MMVVERTADVLTGVSFEALKLSPGVNSGLSQLGFSVLSPVQLISIPHALCGKDVVIQAKSGTGKTLCFAIVALETVCTSLPKPQVLVITPTREIAVQVTHVISSLGTCLTGLRVHSFIGGTSVYEDKKHARGCHVAVGTPGRMSQLIEEGALDLSDVCLFVLDEADNLMDDSFRQNIEDVFDLLPSATQVLALSATFPPALEEHIVKHMKNPEIIRVQVDSLELIGIEQYVSILPSQRSAAKLQKLKVEHLLKIFEVVEFTQCMLFTNFQTRAESIASFLTNKGWPARSLSAHLDQTSRLQTLAYLQQMKCRIVACTDLAARGIDAENVNLVINVDVPVDSSTYLHRIGRAGRFGGQGIAISLASEGEELEHMRSIVSTVNVKIRKLPETLDIFQSDERLNLELLEGNGKILENIDYTKRREEMRKKYAQKKRKDRDVKNLSPDELESKSDASSEEIGPPDSGVRADSGGAVDGSEGTVKEAQNGSVGEFVKFREKEGGSALELETQPEGGSDAPVYKVEFREPEIAVCAIYGDKETDIVGEGEEQATHETEITFSANGDTDHNTVSGTVESALPASEVAVCATFGDNFVGQGGKQVLPEPEIVFSAINGDIDHSSVSRTAEPALPEPEIAVSAIFGDKDTNFVSEAEKPALPEPEIAVCAIYGHKDTNFISEVEKPVLPEPEIAVCAIFGDKDTIGASETTAQQPYDVEVSRQELELPQPKIAVCTIYSDEDTIDSGYTNPSDEAESSNANISGNKQEFSEPEIAVCAIYGDKDVTLSSTIASAEESGAPSVRNLTGKEPEFRKPEIAVCAIYGGRSEVHEHETSPTAIEGKMVQDGDKVSDVERLTEERTEGRSGTPSAAQSDVENTERLSRAGGGSVVAKELAEQDQTLQIQKAASDMPDLIQNHDGPGLSSELKPSPARKSFLRRMVSGTRKKHQESKAKSDGRQRSSSVTVAAPEPEVKAKSNTLETSTVSDSSVKRRAFRPVKFARKALQRTMSLISRPKSPSSYNPAAAQDEEGIQHFREVKSPQLSSLEISPVSSEHGESALSIQGEKESTAEKFERLEADPKEDVEELDDVERVKCILTSVEAVTITEIIQSEDNQPAECKRFVDLASIELGPSKEVAQVEIPTLCDETLKKHTLITTDSEHDLPCGLERKYIESLKAVPELNKGPFSESSKETSDTPSEKEVDETSDSGRTSRNQEAVRVDKQGSQVQDLWYNHYYQQVSVIEQYVQNCRYVRHYQAANNY